MFFPSVKVLGVVIQQKRCNKHWHEVGLSSSASCPVYFQFDCGVFFKLYFCKMKLKTSEVIGGTGSFLHCVHRIQHGVCRIVCAQ